MSGGQSISEGRFQSERHLNLQLCDFLRASGSTPRRIFFRNFGDLSKRVDILPLRLILSHSLAHSLFALGKPPSPSTEQTVLKEGERSHVAPVACRRTGSLRIPPIQSQTPKCRMSFSHPARACPPSIPKQIKQIC